MVSDGLLQHARRVAAGCADQGPDGVRPPERVGDDGAEAVEVVHKPAPVVSSGGGRHRLLVPATRGPIWWLPSGGSHLNVSLGTPVPSSPVCINCKLLQLDGAGLPPRMGRQSDVPEGRSGVRGADSSAAGVPTSPPAARHGDGWGPAANGGIEAGTSAAISLAARASCCGLKQQDAMAGLRLGVLLLTVGKKVNLTASSSGEMCGA
ncbi:hypothetical protein C2845_PM02G30440 [Panicum miliaceum]|uniref:Uncharacterized protein n=1 Tax=Panicum miliaceum TaxID=4540 RepID=A0A3L6SFK4_PANMI|nr:hypothetical protein C2845_PM02G30440 [Panicum miliaceum]